MRMPLTAVVLAGFVFFYGQGQAAAAETSEDPRDRKIRELEQKMEELAGELRALKEDRPPDTGERIEKIETRVEEIEKGRLADVEEKLRSRLGGLHFGGYGEMHANFVEGEGGDKFDIHRLVLYLGYDFSDWIKFHFETELEHAFVSEEGGGELSIEQAYVDFLLSDLVNVRVGRILTPLEIINKKHEPPTFNGVERPSFSRYIIPTTWGSDGIGIFGSLAPWLTYEAYVVGGLDGSKFTAKDGIRGGRLVSSPSFNDPAVTGRLDFHPFATREVGHGQKLRLGTSAYAGGLDNGDDGKNPGIDGDIRIFSGDFEYSISRFDFRGAIAHTQIDGAEEIGAGVASEMFGWYAECGYHFWPDAWKRGKLEKSDAVVFVRYDDYDTQYKMPSGVAGNPKFDRNDWTVGVNFYPTPNFVIKADYQFRDDATGTDPGNLFNLGVGWTF